MASGPYNIPLIIQYPSGTALANVNVTVRIESTNESHTETTNSAGEVIFGLGNTGHYPSGWRIGDVFSYTVFYTGFEASGSNTITSIPFPATTVVLTAVPTAPTLRYYVPQEFLDYFNLKIYEDDKENGIKLQQLVKIGESVEGEIDTDCNSVFDDNNGSYYSHSEYFDTDKFNREVFLTKKPISSITNVYTTQATEDSAPDYTNNTDSWTSLTEGTDFITDLTTGRIVVTNSSFYPISRRWGLYAVYKYGRSSVPNDIKQLAIIETGIRMGLGAVTKAKIGDQNATSTDFMEWFNSYRMRIINKYQYKGISNT